MKVVLRLPRAMPLPEPEDEHEQGNRDADDHADGREPNDDLRGTDLWHRDPLTLEARVAARRARSGHVRNR
jgi:hypothetical protein